jgi:hypothetical protein
MLAKFPARVNVASPPTSGALIRRTREADRLSALLSAGIQKEGNRPKKLIIYICFSLKSRASHCTAVAYNYFQ